MLRRIPLTLKALLATVLVGAATWSVLDFWQTDHLKAIFHARLKEVVGEKAQTNRVIFDHNIKLHQQAVQLLAAQRNLLDFLNQHYPRGKRPPDTTPADRTVFHRRPPDWLPRTSVLRGLVPLRFLLLLGVDGTVLEVYQGQPERPPHGLLDPSPMLRQLSHNQTFLTTIDDAPYLITSEVVLDRQRRPRATLMLANPLDDTFLAGHMKTSSPFTGIVALLEGDNPRVIASNDSQATPAGTPLSRVMQRYLVAGQSFFDYGASDLLIQLVTLVSTESFESLNQSILEAERKQRSITALALILAALLIVLRITHNIQQVTRNIVDFSKNILGAATPEASSDRDELFILRERFQNLAKEIIQTRDNLQAELEERQKAEKEIRKLSHTVEQSPVAVMITDERGFITYVNPKFSGLTGYSPPEVLGRTPRFLASEETPESVYKSLWETISAGRVWRGELSNRRKDGSVYWEMNTISQFMDPETKTRHYLAIKEDISPRIKMEQAMRQAREAAEAANQVKDDFLNNVSHELRTPLHTISGCTNLLLDKEFGEINKTQKKYLKNVLSGAEQLYSLLSDLLDLSKVTTEQFILEERFFNLLELMESITVTIDNHAREKGLSFTYKAASTIPSRVKGDPVRLRQLLIHLLQNAIKFTPKGEVCLALSQDSAHCSNPDAICFIISDTGIGIPEEIQKTIFDPFIQADSSPSRAYGGSGLGLTIARNLIELMGGKILLQSKVDVGSAFFVTIPFKTPDRASDPEKEVFANGVTKGVYTVVAGKNPVNRLILKTLLLSLGLEVEELSHCHSATELTEAIGSKRPDLLCLDCFHSVSGGIAEIRRIRDMPAFENLPILLFSTVAENIRELAPDLSRVHFLNRPIQRQQLMETVQLALSNENEQPSTRPMEAGG